MKFKHLYYHQRINESFRFLVPAGCSVLYLGNTNPDRMPDFQAKRLVAVDPVRTQDEDFEAATYLANKYHDFSSQCEGPFDRIVINGALGETSDICQVLSQAREVCRPSTRILIYQHNHLWQGFLNFTARLGLKNRDTVQNWLSIADLSSYLTGCGFEVVRTYRKTIFPLKMGFIGPVLNTLSSLIPFLDWLLLDQYLIARPAMERYSNTEEPSLTVCITVRNERDNIEATVANMPIICSKQEILFVEGQSTDGTLAEIERVIDAYPKKNVRIIGQPGKGQGDAIRVGFQQAAGDIIILFEGDGTADPADIGHFYNAMRANRFEFIEGSRFVYPLNNEEMAPINQFGNMIFATYFSWFFGQRMTDVLSGIKAVFKEDYQVVYDQWGFVGPDDPFGDFELLFGAARFGHKIGELPMKNDSRHYGESKTRVIYHGLRLSQLILASYRVFRRLS